MRTFEQYIREAVDFRLGGKDGKGEAALKSFRDLERDDIIYYWYISLQKNAVVMHEERHFVGFATNNKVIKTWVDRNGKIVPMYCDVPADIKDKDFTAFIASYSSGNVHLFSTKKLSDEEAVETVLKYKKSIESDLLTFVICESADFRLGGSANKGKAASKNFGELENGDSIYYWEYKNDGKLVIKSCCEIYSIEQRSAGRELFIKDEKTERCIFITERGYDYQMHCWDNLPSTEYYAVTTYDEDNDRFFKFLKTKIAKANYSDSVLANYS